MTDAFFISLFCTRFAQASWIKWAGEVYVETVWAQYFLLQYSHIVQFQKIFIVFFLKYSHLLTLKYEFYKTDTTQT